MRNAAHDDPKSKVHKMELSARVLGTTAVSFNGLATCCSCQAYVIIPDTRANRMAYTMLSMLLLPEDRSPHPMAPATGSARPLAVARKKARHLLFVAK